MGVRIARFIGPKVMLAVGVVLSLALSPAANAASNPVNCRDIGGARVCQKQGHSSLHSIPTVRAPAAGLWSPAWMPGFGRGPLPPMIALG